MLTCHCDLPSPTNTGDIDDMIKPKSTPAHWTLERWSWPSPLADIFLQFFDRNLGVLEKVSNSSHAEYAKMLVH